MLLLWQPPPASLSTLSVWGFKSKKIQKERNPLLVGGKRNHAYGSKNSFKGVVNNIFWEHAKGKLK